MSTATPPRPASVLAAAGAVGVLVLIGLLGLIGNLMNLGTVPIPEALISLLGLFTLWGILVGHRLAWQWGRLLGLFAAVIYTLVIGLSLTGSIIVERGIPDSSRYLVYVILIATTLCLYVIYFAMGTTSAREYFRLRCPQCTQFTSTSADFFFNKAKCNGCKTVWE
jgi:hypothetical protein